RVLCPHCRTSCQVNNQHLGSPVRCGKCRRPFAVRTPAAPTASVSDETEMLLELDGPAAAHLEQKREGRAQPAAIGWRPPSILTSGCLDIGAATSPGRVRSRNEDSFLVQHFSWSTLDQRREVALVIVADGLGGHEAGDQASGLVIRTVAGTLAGLLG